MSRLYGTIAAYIFCTGIHKLWNAFMTARFRNKYRIESARHPSHDYTSAGWYHVVICTHGRTCFFGEVKNGIMGLSVAGIVAHRCVESIPHHFSHAHLDAFCVMPNHVHIILGLATETGAAPKQASFGPLRPGSLSAIVQAYKATVTRCVRKRGITEFRWQPRFYDRIIRSEKELAAIRIYVLENPLKWSYDRYNTE